MQLSKIVPVVPLIQEQQHHIPTDDQRGPYLGNGRGFRPSRKYEVAVEDSEDLESGDTVQDDDHEGGEDGNEDGPMVWGGRCARLYSRSEEVCRGESEEGEEVAAKGAVLGIAIVLQSGQSPVLPHEDGL